MLDDLIIFAFAWVLIGAFVAMLSDPGVHVEFAVSEYARRNGRIAPPAYEVFALAHLIAMWPRVLLTMIRTRR